MTTITLELPDEVRAVIDAARGEQDVASFLVAAGEQVAKHRLAPKYPAPLADELTAADHIRMAEEAEADAVDLDEFRRILRVRMAEQDAEWVRIQS
ncbi:MAG: hypothetical protein DLM69_08370 [Candidatus Chloroheliales bacterium]|nr:MAG: hypothetical protein DLM69_08370 [Chloroflexota bacterium]